MSSFIIVGFLGLTSGCRVRSDVTRPDGTPLVLWHVIYDTCIICAQPPSLPAELQKYSPINDVVYPDDTVAFVVAKAYVPPVNISKTVLLDTILMIPVPGDPSSTEYDERVPDLCTPLVFGIGTVAAAHDSAPNTPVYFPTTVSEFVRGSPKQTVIQYVFVYYIVRMLIMVYFLLVVGSINQFPGGGTFPLRIGVRSLAFWARASSLRKVVISALTCSTSSSSQTLAPRRHRLKQAQETQILSPVLSPTNDENLRLVRLLMPVTSLLSRPRVRP